MSICKTAIIHPEATIGENVTIGSYCVIGKCVIAQGCVLHPYVFIGNNVVINADTEIFHGAVIGKTPKSTGALARIIKYDEAILIGSHVSICPHAVIYYDVFIGNHTLIGDGASIREQCRIGGKCIISRYVTINYNVHIGHRVKIMDLTHITGNTVIEDDVFIAPLVGTANDNMMNGIYDEDIVGQYIKSKAKIGVGANLLPHVEIGQDTLIGAGSLVTKNVKNYVKVKGIPAREY